MCFKHLKVFTQKYATFSGRAQRAEFFCLTLFIVIGYVALLVIDHALGLAEESIGLFSGIFIFVSVLPSISVFVRRLHDVGKSGWWYFVYLIPIIGLVVLIFTFLDSKKDNEYGKNPNNLKI
ncbi:MAG: Inner membrane protein YhaI [Catillopecten margaritatus gill symbiont]|uniref:Inner membrane protein YhaI n=1 Tax=Catillopecten margaritatus gill symbiont TaxID=3083288 RepID=A0AAU6PHL3_9GAMM